MRVACARVLARPWSRDGHDLAVPAPGEPVWLRHRQACFRRPKVCRDLDRIYGTRINLHADDPDAALHVMEDASVSVRGPLETCPGCRITFAVPAAIAAARAGELELAEKHEAQCAYLANVVMRLPAWYAAHDEVRGHIAAGRGAAEESLARFAAAAARFREAGHPIDAERCDGWAAQSR